MSKKTKKPTTSIFRPERDLTIINVYGASEVRSLAIPFDLLAAFYVSFGKTIEEFQATFNPWTRVNLFCANNGVLWVVPLTSGCLLLRYSRHRASDRSADDLEAFFNSLPSPYDLGVDQMLKGNFLALAQQAHEDLSANKPTDWWVNGLEDVWVPAIPTYQHLMMTSRLGVAITREGQVVKPKMNSIPPTPKPLILQ